MDPQSLFLLCWQDSEAQWDFPQATLQTSEMLGVAAERAVTEATSRVPRLFYFRKQPIGHMWSAYNDAEKDRTKRYGRKVFFYSALVVDCYESIWADEPVLLNPPLKEFGWFTKAEVKDHFDEEAGLYVEHLLP